MPLRQPFALEQVGDQVTHVLQIAQQGLACRAPGHQFGVESRPRQGRAQFMADREQQFALGIEHGADVLRHGIDLGCQLTQLVLATHGDRLVEQALPEALSAGAHVIQRPDQVPHQAVGQGRQQQQAAQGHPADAPRPVGPVVIAEPEHDAVPVRGLAPQQPGILVVGCLVVMPLALPWVGIELRDRTIDAHRQRQPLRKCPGPRRIRRRADLRRQPVDVVHDDRPQQRVPACRQRALHARDEDGRRGQGHQHEEQDQPDAQRSQQGPQPGCGPHATAPAKVYPALRSVLMQSRGSSLRRRRLTRMSTARVCRSAS